MDVIVLLQMVKVLYCVRSQPPPRMEWKQWYMEWNSGIWNGTMEYGIGQWNMESDNGIQ